MSAADWIDLLLLRTWWTWSPSADVFSWLYRGLNFVEGAIWLVLAGLVLRRRLRHRGDGRPPWELAYAGAFLTFGLSDFREAYALQSWLILAKGVNLAVLLALRRIVLRRYYPQSRTY